MKINVGLSRKLPGAKQFESNQASIYIEVDIDQALANDPLKLQAQIRKLYNQCHAAVLEELHGRNPGSNGTNGTPPSKKEAINGQRF